jgi:hypothetical protein
VQVVLQQADAFAARLGDLLLLDPDRLFQHRRQRVLGVGVLVGAGLLVARLLVGGLVSRLVLGLGLRLGHRLGSGCLRRAGPRQRDDRDGRDADLRLPLRHL